MKAIYKTDSYHIDATCMELSCYTRDYISKPRIYAAAKQTNTSFAKQLSQS